MQHIAAHQISRIREASIIIRASDVPRIFRTSPTLSPIHSCPKAYLDFAGIATSHNRRKFVSKQSELDGCFNTQGWVSSIFWLIFPLVTILRHLILWPRSLIKSLKFALWFVSSMKDSELDSSFAIVLYHLRLWDHFTCPPCASFRSVAENKNH